MDPNASRQVPWWRRPSALALIAANLVPIWGVLFGSWSAGSVIFLFWLENVVIGLFNIAKMLTCGALSESPLEKVSNRAAAMAGAIFLSAFFTVHFGIFCFVHGMFVLRVSGIPAGFGSAGLEDAVIQQMRGELRYGILALFVSHGFSFVWNFLVGREYRLVKLQDLFGAPYGRVVILHVALIFGTILVIAMGSPAAVLLILVAGKILLDLKLHLKEREKGAIGLVPRRKIA